MEESDDNMKFVGIVGIISASTTYSFNAGGNGLISFIAACALTRLAMDMKLPDGNSTAKWLVALIATSCGTLMYGVIGGMLNPELQAPDRQRDDRY